MTTPLKDSILTSNDKVLTQIKSSYEQSHQPNSSIKFPSGIISTITGKTVQLLLTPDTILSNMQTDGSAFEGWALVIKRWTDYEKVILKWGKPENIDNQHYQRFLFRVIHFVKLFPLWVVVHDDCKVFILDSKIVQGWTYFVNVPTINRTKPDPTTLKGESQLEALFLVDPTLKKITSAFTIDRQLPVGVFSTYPISTKYQIFTGKKSAIDLWGLTYEDKLLLFELKDHTNKSVGIVSELLFYSNIMRLLQNDIFTYPPTNQLIGQLCFSKGI